MELTLEELAADLGARVEGDVRRIVTELAPLEGAGPASLSFFSNQRYKRAYLATKAGAVLVSPAELALERPPAASLLVVDSPYLAFAKAAARFHPVQTPAPGIDPRAAISGGAQIDPSATVHAFAVVEAGARVGPRTVLHAHCVLLEGAVVGADCLIYPGVVIRERCTVGDRTIIQPGAVIGGDGFGFAFDPDGPDGMRHFKIPHAGTVEIAPEVELGANTCVDRATMGVTRVGRGAKIDNLVQIAHNVEVGPLSLVAGCSGIAGSTRLGMGVVVGGRVAITDHLEIGDGARIGGASAVVTDIASGSTVSGYPAHDHKTFLREAAAIQRLPELLKELRALRKRVEALEKERT